MKLKDAYKKFQEDNEIREKFIVAAKESKLNDFIVEHNLECTEEELVEYVNEIAEHTNCDEYAVLASIGTLGISCVISVLKKDDARCGF